MDLSDAMLGAYIDGEVDDQTRADLEQALALDSGARLRLAHLRAADAELKAALPLIAVSNSDPLAERILEGAFTHAPAPRRSRRRGAAVYMALAAGGAGLIAGYFFAGRVKLGDGSAFPVATLGAELNQTLEASASGTTRISDGTDLRIVFSFATADGRYCRVFEQHQAADSVEGVACRAQTVWQVEAWNRTSERGAGFRPAGGNDLIDGVIDRLGGGPALDAAQEKMLIGHQWTAAKP